MRNFTSQKVYQMITQKQNAQKKGVASAGGELGSGKPMTLAEHDKAVHGGHYNGGRCKFRQQLAAMGKLPPNSGSGNGNDGTSAQPTGTSSDNSIKPTNENPSADTGKSDDGQKSPVVQEDGELKRKFGQVSTTSQEAMNNVNEIQRLYSKAQTEETRNKIEEIYKGLVQRLGGGESNSSSVNANVKEEDFSPKTHEEIEDWYDKKSTELETRKGNGEISEEEYNRLQDELDAKSDSLHGTIGENKGGEDLSEEDKRRLYVQMRLAGEGNGSSPQPNKEMSEGRKSLRESLAQHLGSKIDDGSATEKDEEHLDFLEAHRNADEALSKGKITAEEHAKRKKEINDDFARRQYARKFGVEYKPYEPKQKTSWNGDASSSVNNNTPSLSEQRDSLQKSLKTMQFLFGKKSILGNYLTGKYENQIGELNKKIKDVESGKKQISEEAKKVISNPDGKKNSGLRTIHGEVKHGGNSEIQKLIEQMEDEYANAKNSGEKMRIMNRYEMLKKKYEPQTSTQSKKDDSPIVKKDAVEEAISNMSENESYNKYQELLFKSSKEEESLSDDEKRMLDMLYKKHGIGK